MNKVTKLLFCYLIFVAFCLLGSCSPGSGNAPFDIASIQSYREIPGITEEEITAIEALRAVRRSFSYGSIHSIGAFNTPDGRMAGFSNRFCRLLSDLFGIPFVLEILPWDSLISGLDSGVIDFTGDFAPTPERRLQYHMTHPIAYRTFCIVRYGDSVIIESESDINGLNVGFFAGAVHEKAILDTYPLLKFEAVPILNTADAIEKLANGVIDVLVTDTVTTTDFAGYPLIHSKEFFPLVYSPVSLTTGNSGLMLIVSVMNK
jgi:ABC-type amino acid transport substrate-binding protein